ncbi:MAG: hypothetical protein IKM34_07225 [Clostridia bacterium]|nr:hypothetical protein [Clostridia bacterium]
MKRILMVLIAVLVLSVLVSCGDESAVTTKEADATTPAETTAPTTIKEVLDTTTETPVTTKAPVTTSQPESISRPAWEAMLSAAKFENYTLSLEGAMTVTQNGESAVENNVKETVKVTADKVLAEMYAEDEDSSASDKVTLLFEGDVAKAHKIQYEQIFLALLSDYDNFVYDAASGTYKVANTVSMDIVLKAVSLSGNGTITEIFDVPAVIEMREATVELSADGSLVKLVCDYSQKMELGIVTETSGITTWTFSNYGTTVIE